MMETLTVQPPNATKVATKWALINLLAQIVLTYVIQFLNLDPNSSAKWIWIIIMGAFLFLAQKEYREALGGFMTFGEGFSAGFRFSLFSGLLVGVFLYVYLAILSPEVMVKSMEAQRTVYEQKNMSNADIDKAISVGTKYGPIIGAFFTAIFYAIIGAIVGLIGAAIFKKERSAEDILNALENQAPDDLDPTV